MIKKLEAHALQLRIDSLRITTAAGSGHPTSCLSVADIISALFFNVLKHDLSSPDCATNDRFILSKGHAIPIVYAAYKQLGVISDQEMLTCRQFDSVLEGHPTPRFAYNQAATGSLGQGLACGLGMALDARLKKRDYRVFVVLGDGEIAEGSVWEAADLAAHQQTGNLIAFVDCNGLGQSGEPINDHDAQKIAQKFVAFGWDAQVVDGHNMQSLVSALNNVSSLSGKPHVIVAKTLKGYGLDGIEGKPGYHGKPFTKQEEPVMIALLQKRFASAAGVKIDLSVPVIRATNTKNKNLYNACLDINVSKHFSAFARANKIATRKAFGLALADLGNVAKDVVALDGDVKNSTYTDIFEKEFPDRFIQCFIAEQNMVGVATGLALRGSIPFAATFGCFFSRAYDQIRMAAIGRAAVRLCGSHTGVSIGQDGPSQMALEDISMMAAIPESVVLWPSDGVSTYKLVDCMAAYHDGVSYIKTTRADTHMLYDTTESFEIGGSKVLKSSSLDKACIVAAGITVHEALKAAAELEKQGIHVSIIDAYSVKPLDVATIIKSAKTSGNIVITVEDHYIQGGLGQIVAAALCNENIYVKNLAVTKMPRSASPEELLAYEGIDSSAIVDAVKKNVQKN